MGKDSATATITFINHHEQPLTDGSYTLSLTHTLTYLDETRTFKKNYKYQVCGNRFILPPNEIHKVFPPANSKGDFDSVLPHIVLKRRTLPWERKSAESEGFSWLALLIFVESSAPKVTVGTFADLYPSTTKDGNGKLPSNTYSYGSNNPIATFLELYQNSTDACVWFDLPPTTFSYIAPSLNDLQWNAHARYRSDTDTDYAVVVANRLAPPGTTVIAHLVSLEGMGGQLPQDDGTFSAKPTWDFIRLVSLKSWQFSVGPLQESFAAILNGLNGGINGNLQKTDCMLRLPSGYLPRSGVITQPLDSGYTVLAEPSSNNAAWYRGPFWPATLMPNKISNSLPANSASDLNTAVSAQPNSDCSYSAAWQLGRLIALADNAFASAQVAWKRACRLKLNTLTFQSNTQANGSRYSYAQAIRETLASSDYIKNHLGQQLTTTSPSNGNLLIPQNLVDWLCKLALLNSVPFNYLVSDPCMLPTESLRVFNIDPCWIACLLDGAWSLGREPKEIWAFDATYQPWKQIQDGSLLSSFAKDISWPQSGILLNSRLLPGYWPSIDFSISNQANILREDLLNPNILLLLFDKAFQDGTALTIQQHPEGIHFGFDIDESRKLSKILKYLTLNNTLYPATTQSPAPATGTNSSSTLSQIPQRIPGFIQFNSLAGQIISALGVQQQGFTSAEFALELIELIPSVTFTLLSK